MGDKSGSPCDVIVEGDRGISAYRVKRKADNSHLTWMTKLTSAHHPRNTKQKRLQREGWGIQTKKVIPFAGFTNGKKIWRK